LEVEKKYNDILVMLKVSFNIAVIINVKWRVYKSSDAEKQCFIVDNFRWWKLL
jgi:hypothetical protein